MVMTALLAGTVAGASWTTAGKYGNALTFDGVDDWVVLHGGALTASSRLTRGSVFTVTLPREHVIVRPLNHQAV